TLHHVILPWPVVVEISVRAAELRSLQEESDKPGKYYVGRRLRRVFRQAGLERIETRTFATDRQAPLAPNEKKYFQEYLKSLSQTIASHLQGPVRSEFDRLVDPR